MGEYEFCVGDVVMANDDRIDANACIKGGMTGIVVNIVNDPLLIGVQWDTGICGHSCNGNGPDGFCWYVTQGNIRRITSISPEIPDISEEEFSALLCEAV